MQTIMTDFSNSSRQDEAYIKFAEKYNIHLNSQQEKALRTVDGHILLLAVPGSGKTTVLTARLGYMISELKIPPESILALTYNRQAAGEMKQRFCSVFGSEMGQGLEFRTLNGFSYSVYLYFCKKYKRPIRKLIVDSERRKIITGILKKNNPNEYPADGDILQLETDFTYIKNMQIAPDKTKQFDNRELKVSKLYEKYQEYLKENNLMDYDDQMVFAEAILSKRPNELALYRNKFRYICVDEAQDTSKIQHSIIRLLAEHNNLFMVGDEDQSIYGFRAAYPQALLDFGKVYDNPIILNMETNYRSTENITELAQSFISGNKNRYKKQMKAVRPAGKSVDIIDVFNRKSQYKKLMEIAKKCPEETAFLYRENETAVVLADMFMRDGIPFRVKQSEVTFFSGKVVNDIKAYLALSLNDRDAEAFCHICNKGFSYLEKSQKDRIASECKKRQISVYDAAEQLFKSEREFNINRMERFRHIMQNASTMTTEKAIREIFDKGYSSYFTRHNLDYEKIETLLCLAAQEKDIASFLSRLDELKGCFINGFSGEGDKGVILSTVHSSKGMEYDNVYMVDVFDGGFPSENENFCGTANREDAKQEERRLFYVGITRAKNTLHFFKFKKDDYYSSYLSELFKEK